MVYHVTLQKMYAGKFDFQFYDNLCYALRQSSLDLSTKNLLVEHLLDEVGQKRKTDDDGGGSAARGKAPRTPPAAPPAVVHANARCMGSSTASAVVQAVAVPVLEAEATVYTAQVKPSDSKDPCNAQESQTGGGGVRDCDAKYGLATFFERCDAFSAEEMQLGSCVSNGYQKIYQRYC